MPSLSPGYNYDIFISYRHKDNKGDRWVSKFVDALKTELESTFKEDISVYFDENPHDRLQDTHDVDKSLEGKLKCLILIPILSQTYCDPNSYAWQHEFLAFLQMVKNDRFGKDVRLRNGNVASRILPIRIHDLENEDVKLFEKETGGVLRALDFVFKTANGTIRPLSVNEDHPTDNLNKTFYRDQISKVAIAIKEIIIGMRSEQLKINEARKGIIVSSINDGAIEIAETKKKPARAGKSRFFIPAAICVLLTVAGIIVYPRIFKENLLERLRGSDKGISVAVMPFQNMTNDTTNNILGYWIQEALINYLSGFPDELKVKQTESINNVIKDGFQSDPALITPLVAGSISKKLDAKIFIIGSIRHQGGAISLSAQLIDSRTNEVLKAFEKGPLQEVILDSLINGFRKQIADFLVLSRLREKENPQYSKYISTSDPKAYSFWKLGMRAFSSRNYPAARELLLQAIKLDSNFVFAKVWLGWALSNMSLYKEAKECSSELYRIRDQVPINLRIRIMSLYAHLHEGPQSRITYLMQQLEIDDQDINAWGNLGECYNTLGLFDNAVLASEKVLAINRKLGLKPFWSSDFTRLGYAFHKKGRYDKETKVYAEAQNFFPDDPAIIYRQTILALTLGDTTDANRFLSKLEAFGRQSSMTEQILLTRTAALYSQSEMPDKAEHYYRRALLLDPHNPATINNLAYFLIDKDRNPDEGLELASQLTISVPQNFNFLHTEGWGFYKKGRYAEALEILQKSWDLRMKNAVYNHEAFLHLEAAKKAVAEQKNN